MAVPALLYSEDNSLCLLYLINISQQTQTDLNHQQPERHVEPIAQGSLHGLR